MPWHEYLKQYSYCGKFFGRFQQLYLSAFNSENEKLYSNKTLYNNFYDNIGNNSNILWWKNVSAKTSKSIQWNITIQQCKIIEILMHAITRIDNEGIIVNEKSHLGCVVLFLKFLRWQNSRDRQQSSGYQVAEMGQNGTGSDMFIRREYLSWDFGYLS